MYTKQGKENIILKIHFYKYILMIASKIGKTFLKAYNQKYDKEYSAKEFFDEVYFELFYNHPKYIYLCQK